MRYKLGELCTISSAKRIFEKEYVKKGIPFIRGLEITDGSILSENAQFECYISRKRYDELKKTNGVPQKGDILITAVGTIGNLCYIDSDREFYFKDGNVIWLKNFNSQINSKYLYYFMKTSFFVRQLECAMIGAVQKALTMIMLEKIEIELPDYKKQVSAVKVLEYIDEKIRINNRISAELESMAKTIYDYWFLQFEFPNEEGKPYKSSGGKMVWDEELKREIPDGWGSTTIDKIANCLDSKRIPLSGEERRRKSGNIPYYGATGIMDYVDEAIFEGDYVLMAEDGSVMDEKGHPILQRVSGKAWINNHTHVLKPIKGHSCKLLMMLLKDIFVTKIKTGSIQMKINQENLKKIVVLDIPDMLIEKMNGQLEIIDSKILHLEKENKVYISLRDFLLPLLMNGQVGFKN